jgi:hypothetical protein
MHSFIQGVSDVLEQTSRASYSHQNKEKCSHEHVSGKGWFLSLIERLHSTINNLTMRILITADIIH